MNEPYWIQSARGKSYDSLKKDLETDLVIIGAGITGITCAYLLAKNGIKSVVLDAGKPGWGGTGRNTGKATVQHGPVYGILEKKYGLDKAALYYKSQAKALELIETLCARHEINCGFERLPAYLYTLKQDQVDTVEREYELCKKIGMEVSLHDTVPLPFKVEKAVCLNHQAQFHPKKYLDALCEQCLNMGVKIYANAQVIDFEPGPVCTLKIREDIQVKASTVVIASHFPCYDGMDFFFARLKPERSYIVAGRYEGEFPKAHFINIEDPTRSLRLIKEENLLLFSGESHKVGHQKEGEDYYRRLEDFGREHFGIKEFPYRWSAQDYHPADSLPFAGVLSDSFPNIFVATGYSKWGMTCGTSAALTVSGLILSEDSEARELYSTERMGDIFSVAFLKENADVAVQLIGGKLKMGSEGIPEERGVGRIIMVNGKRCGYYREERGEAFVVDITCTHMGCELTWNELELSWDCPCHGSRFDYKGNILEGPAQHPLRSYENEKNRINPQIV